MTPACHFQFIDALERDLGVDEHAERLAAGAELIRTAKRENILTVVPFLIYERFLRHCYLSTPYSYCWVLGGNAARNA